MSLLFRRGVHGKTSAIWEDFAAVYNYGFEKAHGKFIARMRSERADFRLQYRMHSLASKDGNSIVLSVKECRRNNEDSDTENCNPVEFIFALHFFSRPLARILSRPQ